ncbi:MAG: TrbI/VirB10 family protein [Xanthomonadaceae bacterium]|nr:TrbI/VirB10 family protein [Xanthomonadaceae bacterium]
MIIIFILHFSSFSDQTDNRIQHLRTNQKNIESMMSKMGLEVERSESGELTRKNIAPTLFVKHADSDRLRIPMGTVLYGSILQELIIGGDPTPVFIFLNSNQNQYSGLKITGLARASSSGRIHFEFNKLHFNGGRTASVQAQALDNQGALGLEPSQILSAKALSLVGSMAGSFVSGYAASQQSQVVSPIGINQNQITPRNSILQGVAQSAADQSKRLIDEAIEEKPVFILKPGADVSIYFTEEVRY